MRKNTSSTSRSKESRKEPHSGYAEKNPTNPHQARTLGKNIKSDKKVKSDK